MKERMKHLILFIILVGIDQVVKYLVRQNLMNQEPITILPNKILNLQYHENTGAVWGILSGNVLYLSIFTLLILILIVYLYLKIPQTKRMRALRILSVFILAGAVGNLIDRIFLGHVVDFIYFEFINFPLFNIADSYLTVSCILLLFLAIFYYKDEDLAFLDPVLRKKKTAQTAVTPADGKETAGFDHTPESEVTPENEESFTGDQENVLFDRSKDTDSEEENE